MSTILSIRNLSKTFCANKIFLQATKEPTPGSDHHTKALDHVNLDLPRGTILGIQGPNGSGKSTILRIIATLLLPDKGSGRVTVNNVDVIREPAKVRPLLGIITGDERSLNHRLSIGQNLEFFAALYGFSPRQSKAQVARVMDELFLNEIETLPYGKASTGMKQRALVAKALLHTPQLILADELTKGLDPQSSDRIIKLLVEEYVGNRGATLILVEHNHALLQSISDQIFHMENGRGTMTIKESTSVRTESYGRHNLGSPGQDDAQRGGRSMENTPCQ